MRGWLSLALALLCAFVLASAGCGQNRGVAQAPSLSYVLRTTGDAAPDAALPMLIALHGLGDRPEHFVELFSSLSVEARVVAVRAPDAWGRGYSWYPIDDPRRKVAAIERSARRVVALAEQLRKKHPTRGRPVVTGFSQGGVLSFAIAARHPTQIAAALPIAGSLDARIAIRKKKPRPRVHAFHGEADRRIPHEGGQRAVGRMKKSGLDAKLTSFAGLGHGVSAEMQRALFAALSESLAREKARD